MAGSTRRVVVGVDGSEYSMRAALWAVSEASHRDAPVDLVIVNDDPARASVAAKMVREAAERCGEAAPELAITEEVIAGHPAEELMRRSRQAQMVVLGSHGRGGLATTLLGSISAAVAMHAECPVVVVRGETRTTGPVVAGVDESEGSRTALRFAFAAAAHRGAELVAVQVWHEEGLLAVPLPPEDRDHLQSRIERSLAEEVAHWSDQYPGISTRVVVQRGHPVAALADASRDAQLLVVGHRGRSGFEGLLLGSVAAGVLHHAQCPVAVVRPSPRNQA